MSGALPFLAAYGSWMILSWVFLDLTLVPVPSEIVLLVAGSSAASGHIGFDRIIVAAFVAGMLADHFWFLLGRRQGRPAVHLWCRLASRSPQCREKTLAFFSRRGLLSLLLVKFLPGLRAVVPSMVGASGVPYHRFLTVDGIGTLLWAGAVPGLGYLFAEEVTRAIRILGHAHIAVLWGTLGIAIGLSMVGHLQRRRLRGNEGD